MRNTRKKKNNLKKDKRLVNSHIQYFNVCSASRLIVIAVERGIDGLLSFSYT